MFLSSIIQQTIISHIDTLFPSKSQIVCLHEITIKSSYQCILRTFRNHVEFNLPNHHWVANIYIYIGWWFGTCFIFPYIDSNHPNWLIFFRGVETTNQIYTIYIYIFIYAYLYAYIYIYIYIRITTSDLLNCFKFFQWWFPMAFSKAIPLNVFDPPESEFSIVANSCLGSPHRGARVRAASWISWFSYGKKGGDW